MRLQRRFRIALFSLRRLRAEESLDRLFLIFSIGRARAAGQGKKRRLQALKTLASQLVFRIVPPSDCKAV